MIQNVFFFLKNKGEVKFLYDNLSISDGLKLMNEHGFTAMPVINKDCIYKGNITEGDFLWYLLNHSSITAEDLETIKIKELIRKDYMPAVRIDVDLKTLIERSLEQNYVPIVDDRGIFIGIVTRKSIIKYLMNHTMNEAIPYDSEWSTTFDARPSN